MSAEKSFLSDHWVQLLAFLCLVSGAMTAHGFRSGISLSGPTLWAPGARAAPRHLSGPRTPGRWVVDASGAADSDTKSVADAVASAASGDDIAIRPGEYAGSLAIDKTLRLAGEGAPDAVVLRGASTATVSALGAALGLANLTLEHQGPAGTEALLVTGGAVTLANVHIRGRPGLRGAVVSGGALTASATVFEGGSEAVVVESKGSARLSSCTISQAGTAVQVLGEGSSAVLLGTRLTRNHDGISALDRAKVELSGSQLTEQDGRALMADFGAEINDFGSIIGASREASAYAAGRSTLRLDQTRITGGTSGVSLAGGAMLIINRGKISNVLGPGLFITEGSELHLSGTEVMGSKGCGLEIDASSAFLDLARFSGNQCGVAFHGRGKLQSNDGDYTGNDRGAFLYSRAFVSKIYLHGRNNQPADFQAYFR